MTSEKMMLLKRMNKIVLWGRRNRTMKLTKRIERMILRKLSFSNGWIVDEEKYIKLKKQEN